MFPEIKASLRQLYLEDERPWLVGFSGGKDSTMLASLIFDAVLSQGKFVLRDRYRILIDFGPSGGVSACMGLI